MSTSGLTILVELNDRIARISADILFAVVEHFAFAMLHEIRIEHTGPGEIVDSELIEEPAIGLKEFFAGDDSAVVAEAQVFGDAKLYSRLNYVAEDRFFLQIILEFRQMLLVHPGFE